MNLDIHHFKQLDKIIAAVTNAGGLHVTVAGGAVRDSVLEKPIADIDVFYQGELDKEAIEAVFGEQEQRNTIPEMPKIDWLLPANFPVLAEQIAAQNVWLEKYADYEDTFSVDNYKGDVFNLEGMEIQLINVPDVDKHIEQFPCFLSRMCYSEGCLVIPKEAIQDISLGIIRFTDECSEKYKAKIEEKYNDYL